jgi:hypothetical protein
MAIIDGEIRKLEDKHNDYDSLVEQWRFWYAAYDGGDRFIDLVLERNERESQGNYNQRVKEGEVFNYSATIVDLFCNFLSQQQVHRDLNNLGKNEQWEAFQSDVDLYGTNYDVFWNSAEKLASVYGTIGILVDKPTSIEGEVITREDELSNMSYPYLSLFSPENIHDWEFARNPITARPELVYLKLKEENGYLVWTKEEWERWSLKSGFHAEYELVEFDVNQIGEIPFVWHSNYTDLKRPYIGLSDIKGIAKIQAAITRDLSNGNEVIKYAAFPMMRKPFITANTTPEDDTAGVTAILEFDPELPNSKPDWLEAKVNEPITAILSWIDKKILEIYRTSHLSNMHGQATSGAARSGVALRYEYQQLSSVLTAKGQDLNEAELKVVYFWLKWQGLGDVFKGISITRPSSFNIDDLSMQLDHCLLAMNIVTVDSFKKALRKKVARLVLPDESEKGMAVIDDEIGVQKENEPVFDEFVNVDEKP